jgi:Domain of unknown function (DUF4349)
MRFAPGFGFALSVSWALLAGGCAASAGTKLNNAEAASAVAAPGMPGATADGSALLAPEMLGKRREESPTAPPPPPAPVAAPQAAEATLTVGAGAAITPTREMLDIEANVTLRVPKLKGAVKALHDLTARFAGVVISERLEAAGESSVARLTLRVPSGAAPSLFRELEGLGAVTDQTVTARDVGKDYFDAQLRVSSLETTLRRYEEVLKLATKVDEILRIEQELGRLRAEIEQVKGNLRWLADRAARATIHVHLSEQPPEIAASEAPEPKFFPGLRVAALLDVGAHGERGYAGGGLSLRANRAISVDVDLLERIGSSDRGPDVVLATLGGEVYSDLLGGGRRRFCNPYLGWRLGYARFEDDNQALGGVTLGVELYQGRVWQLDFAARNYLVIGGERGAHYALEPSLAASVAF